METNALSVGGSAASQTALAVKDVREQVNLIQHLMDSVMKDGEHYGVIPGCGAKKTLMQPGAQKLAFVFRMGAAYKIEEREQERGHREYRVTCTLARIGTGEVIGEGVGTCSTMEAKYRYRAGKGESTGKGVPPAYWDAKNAGDMGKALAAIGGKGFRASKDDNGMWMIFKSDGERAENPDIADTYNTVLKMGKKRAYVDAVLTATAASDIFTQDIEDSAPDEPSPQNPRKPVANTAQAKPAESSPPAKPVPGSMGTNNVRITEAKEAQKSKPDAAKKWTRYEITTGGGKTLSTFSDTVFERCLSIVGTDTLVSLSWRVNDKGNLEATEVKLPESAKEPLTADTSRLSEADVMEALPEIDEAQITF